MPGDIPILQKKHEDKLASLNLPVQPYLIVETSGTHVRNIYVCFNDRLYAVPTILRGVEACFHCYHIFNLRYQFESEHIWLFIQHAMYDIRTKWDSPFPSILDIVNKVKK